MLHFFLWPASLLFFWRRDQIRCGISLRRAQRQRLRGRRNEAEELFEHSLSFGVTDSRPYVQYALALMEWGEAAKAVELLHNAVEVDPQCPVPLILLGLALSDSGRQEEAIEALRRACEKAPANLLAQSCLSLVQMRSGEIAPAASDLLGRGIADNLSLRARLLASVERHLRGRQTPGPLDDLLPPRADETEKTEFPPGQSARQSFRQAAKALHKGKYTTARALLQAAAGDRKCNGDQVRLYLGGTYLGLGEYDQAAEHFSAMPPSSLLRGAALFYAGVSRYLNEEPQAALELLDQATETGNVYDFEEFIHYYRGLCLLAPKGDEPALDEVAARREFLQALDIDWTLLPRRLEAVVRSSRHAGATHRRAETQS